MKKKKGTPNQERTLKNTKQEDDNSNVGRNLSHIPEVYFPKLGTNASKVLELLADGQSHEKEELLFLLLTDPRSALQALKNATHGFWYIHNTGGRQGCYQLDERHFHGDLQSDEVARLYSAMSLKKGSRFQAERETSRLPRAISAEANAKARLDDAI